MFLITSHPLGKVFWSNDGESTTRPDSTWGIFREKGVSKDPNTETFWADMPFIVLITKAKEENPNNPRNY